ncbi:hypothetical protein KI809_02335 [Geobacter pelophilus]|uniref:PIN domain-containing protein n=1 Tax=Geoanaerobacter pelophilus TaxID=60036 RepID=A0AAW4L5N2_9BACT|nr:hypothetical protein [Geoanaerobacter pelophilus]MBT0663127.1 hypothetical protein [Geoanaerobacter pelophilus]
MKLWLLDADVIIKLLEIDVFDRLVAMHDLHVASTVVDEVKYYRRAGRKFQVDFRQQYITTGLVTETLATAEEMQEVLRRLPLLRQQGVHAGEIESLAVLVRQEDLTLCTFDAAAIRTLPFLDVTERAVSAERLLRTSGLTLSPGFKLDPRLSEEYFRSNVDQGLREFVYSRAT